MVWPFKSRRSYRDNPIKRPTLGALGDSSAYIPKPTKEEDEIITALLVRGQAEAKLHEPGKTFTVELGEEEWERCAQNHIAIVAAVFTRALEYKLMPEWSYNEKFAFSVPTS